MKVSMPMKKKLYVSAATAREYASLSDDPAVRQSFEQVAQMFDDAAAGMNPSPDRTTLVHTGGRQ